MRKASDLCTSKLSMYDVLAYLITVERMAYLLPTRANRLSFPSQKHLGSKRSITSRYPSVIPLTIICIDAIPTSPSSTGSDKIR
jgi:hypothetical protein